MSFGLVGLSGMVVHVGLYALLRSLGANTTTQVVAVITAACSNYLINNALTFRSRRLQGRSLFIGLLKFLWCRRWAWPPTWAFPRWCSPACRGPIAVIAVASGILVDFIWKYAASSRFVWNVPY